MKRLLFVCLGNICRSPTAEAIFRKKLKELRKEIHVDSAGTADYHVGERSDPRSIRHAENHGYEMNHRGRQFQVSDFEKFDLIFVMDHSNYENVIALARTSAQRAKVHRIADFLSEKTHDHVPDPYHGSARDFELVISLLESAFENIVRKFF